MKRVICACLAVLTVLTLLGCRSGKITSGVIPQTPAESASAGALDGTGSAASDRTTATGVPVLTPEPTPELTPEPTPTPTPTPAPVTQQASLDQMLLNASGLSVCVKGLSFAKDYEVTLDYEIVNKGDRTASVQLLLNSANCWSLVMPTAVRANEEAYLDTVTVNAGETRNVTIRYWIGDAAAMRMGFDQIDHFSARVFAEYLDPLKWIGDRTTYVEVTGAPEPACVFPAGDVLLESDPLTVTSLGYDAAEKRIYLYIAHKTVKAGGSLVICPAVNGVAVADKYIPDGTDPTLYISTTNNKQMIVGVDIAPTLAALGVDTPSRLSVCINLYNSRAVPVTLDVPFDDPAPSWSLPDYEVVTETDDILAQYAGVESGPDGDKLVFYVTNKTDSEFLISAKDSNLVVGDETLRGWGACALPPNITTCFSIELHNSGGSGVRGKSGTCRFTFDYSPYIPGTDYYAGARYSDIVTVVLP